MKLMTISLAGLVVLALPVFAQAQTDKVNANSQSGSFSQSGSVAGASSGASTGPTSSGSSLSYTSSTTDNSQYNNRPTAVAPDLAIASANACGLGSSVGAAGGGWFSIGANWTKESGRCGHFNDAQGWSGMGLDIMAVAMLCKTPEDADAFKRVYGVPCPGQPGAPAAPLPPALAYLNAAPASAVISTPVLPPQAPQNCHMVLTEPKNINGSADAEQVCTPQ